MRETQSFAGRSHIRRLHKKRCDFTRKRSPKCWLAFPFRAEERAPSERVRTRRQLTRRDRVWRRNEASRRRGQTEQASRMFGDASRRTAAATQRAELRHVSGRPISGGDQGTACNSCQQLVVRCCHVHRFALH